MPKPVEVISDGVALPKFGKETGRHAMRNRDVNELVMIPLSALVNMQVKVGDFPKSKLFLTKANAILQISASEVQAADPGDPGTATTIVRARIVTGGIFAEYLVCNPWDDDTEDWSATEISVAKPPKLRGSITSEGGFSYSYADSYNTRVATAGGYDSETYSIDRPYAVGEELKAANLGSTGVADVTYEDLNNDARAWIAIPIIPIP